MAREASSDSPAISSQSEEAKHAEYVLYIDADMLLRLPFDPFKLGVTLVVINRTLDSNLINRTHFF